MATRLPSDEQRSRKAFDELLAEHYVRLWAFARALAQDDSEADDVLHDAAISALDSWVGFDQQRPFLPWMRTVIRHRLIDRRRRRQEATISPELAASLEEVHARWDDHLPGNALVDRLGECLEHLGPSGRSTIDLHYRLGLPLATVAERLGIGLNACKKRLERLRDALRRCLGGSPGHEPVTGTGSDTQDGQESP